MTLCVSTVTWPHPPVPEDHADTVDLSYRAVKLRNVISPKPELMLAHTTPKITSPTFSPSPTKMKLSRENSTAVYTLILWREEGGIRCRERGYI